MRSTSILRLLLPLSALLLANPAAANHIPFELQVYENGSLMGDYSQSTTWLGCTDSGNTSTCNGGSQDVGDLTLDSWSLSFDNDPVVTGTVAVTNAAAVDQHYTLIFTLPVAPIGPTSLTSGSIQGGVTSNDLDGATVSTVAGGAFYTALIDGASFKTLYGDPSSATAPALGSGNLAYVDFGLPAPPSFPGPAVTTSIGIQLDFTLTPGDSASFTSNFAVFPVPEPTTGLLIGLGLFGLVVARRR